MKRNNDNGQDDFPKRVTDVDALKDNVESAVESFAQRYLSMPRFTERCVVMDHGQLRDAMGLRATFEAGDPWPKAEELLMKHGFRWHMLGAMRVMYLQERDGYLEDDGWDYGEEVEE